MNYKLVLLLSGLVYWGQSFSKDLSLYLKAGMSYVEATRSEAEELDLDDLKKKHESFNANGTEPEVTNSLIWRYDLTGESSLIFEFRNANYPPRRVKYKPASNPSIVEDNGHLIFRYWDQDEKGKLGPLNYRIEFKNET